ncbi:MULTISPECIES: hypothetical protein [unclassified Psychrobacter]|uniref:hypothetical protein n=1 Tax=unclassified Psychrobacter TaxID=196806 RepID=UPI00041402DB|nr:MULTISPECIES: hypothetical protein [unclassified Psychrobacter]
MTKRSYTLQSLQCIAAAAPLILVGCQPAIHSQNSAAQRNSAISTLVIEDQRSTSASAQTLEQQALRIQQALANGDYASITNDIHPIHGVRFSMYAYVRPESDKAFSRAQFAQYLQESDIRFTWGKKDGTGDLFITPLPTYLDTWVDGKKFNDMNISVNKITNNGNSINNLKDIYQNSDVVEFYYKGTAEYAGMDWRVLRLVFDEYKGRRYLVAIISDQWTV